MDREFAIVTSSNFVAPHLSLLLCFRGKCRIRSSRSHLLFSLDSSGQILINHILILIRFQSFTVITAFLFRGDSRICTSLPSHPSPGSITRCSSSYSTDTPPGASPCVFRSAHSERQQIQQRTGIFIFVNNVIQEFSLA